MFYIQFKEGSVWFDASNHTKEQDAVIQKQRFLDLNQFEEMRVIEEDEKLHITNRKPTVA